MSEGYNGGSGGRGLERWKENVTFRLRALHLIFEQLSIKDLKGLGYKSHLALIKLSQSVS